MFHEITLKDKEWIDQKFAEENWNACEYTFANNFVWRKTYQVEVAEYDSCLIIRYQIEGKDCYSYPIGNGNKKAAIQRLLDEKKEQGRILRLQPVSETAKAELQEWFPDRFLISENRDVFDYIYSREKLVTLAGKKLHGKRNHIARFQDGDDWSYEEMSEENLEECRTMTYAWMRMRAENWSDEMESEVMVLHEAFDHFAELKLVGGVLRKSGEIVAFCIGEPINEETFVVHFEKAYPDMQGAYPMINQQFVMHACENYTYVNREDDTGSPGLRRAKMSYYPEILLKKYSARESHVVFAELERDEEDIAKLWQQCFGETKEDALFYLHGRKPENQMLVIREDGKVVAMASFLPVQYRYGGEYVDARYVYAVATLPEYREKGYATELIETAKKLYGAPLMLVPAETSLETYYKKLGFQKAFLEEQRGKSVEYLAAAEIEVPAVSLEPITAAKYMKIRDKHFEKEGYVRWDEDAIAYAMEFEKQYGGNTIAVTVGENQTEILMYKKKEDQLIITETTLDEKQISQALPTLFQETETVKIVYQGLGGMLWIPEKTIEQEILVDGYLNLTLG